MQHAARVEGFLRVKLQERQGAALDIDGGGLDTAWMRIFYCLRRWGPSLDHYNIYITTDGSSIFCFIDWIRSMHTRPKEKKKTRRAVFLRTDFTFFFLTKPFLPLSLPSLRPSLFPAVSTARRPTYASSPALTTRPRNASSSTGTATADSSRPTCCRERWRNWPRPLGSCRTRGCSGPCTKPQCS